MLASALLVLSVAVALGSGSAEDGICKLNLQTQLKATAEPLILEVSATRGKGQKLEIIRPQVEKINGKNQGVIPVQEGKQLLLACPGLNNEVHASLKQTSPVECSNGELTVNKMPATVENLSCTKGVANSWLLNTNETCGKGDNVGTKFELGFRLTDVGPETFFPMVDVCHNVEKMVTYYTSHQLYGASLDGAVKTGGRRNFSQGPKGMGLFQGINAEKAYSKNGHKQALDDILGVGASKKYTDQNVFLARGHLSPDADFIYNSGQLLTYYFINAAPQWQTFNAGNWLAVENAARKLAAKEQDTLEIWTGTYGILKLEDKEGNEKEIYLDPKESTDQKSSRSQKKSAGQGNGSPKESHLPVPEVFWKIVKHPVRQSCTVAVGHNNVHLKEPPTPICTPVTVDGWPSLTEALDKGYVYYCEYDTFKKTVDYVPDIECTDLFKFPHAN